MCLRVHALGMRAVVWRWYACVRRVLTRPIPGVTTCTQWATTTSTPATRTPRPTMAQPRAQGASQTSSLEQYCVGPAAAKPQSYSYRFSFHHLAQGFALL